MKKKISKPVFTCRGCGMKWYSRVREACEETGLCWGCLSKRTPLPEYISYRQEDKYYILKYKKEIKNDKEKTKIIPM